jgi:hypothetical protein
MKTVLHRITGFLMVTAALVSLLVSAFFLVMVWRYRQPVTTRVVENLDLLYATTVTMEDSLLMVDDTVSSLRAASETISSSSDAIENAIGDGSIMTDSFATLLGDNLTATITDTQTAIISAQASAVVIDNVLSGLASIPFIGIDYNPRVPLNQALGNISDTLSSIPPTLEEIQSDLISTGLNLKQLETDLQKINSNIQNILGTMEKAQRIIDEYQQEISQLKTRLDLSRTASPEWILTAAWVLTFVISWLSISQLGLLLQGFDILLNANKHTVNLPDLHYG